jgi:hypothetical protein
MTLQVCKMEKVKEGHCSSCLRLQGCRGPPSDFQKLCVVRWSPNATTKINCEVVKSIIGQNEKIFVASLPELACLTLCAGVS